MVEHSKDSFVARLWVEDGDNGGTTWRGHILHVQGDEQQYFQDLLELRDFLSRVSGIQGPPLTTKPFKDTTKSE